MTVGLRHKYVMELICLFWIVSLDDVVWYSLGSHCSPCGVFYHLDMLFSFFHLLFHQSVRLGHTRSLDTILPNPVDFCFKVSLLLLWIYLRGVFRHRGVENPLMLVLDIYCFTSGVLRQSGLWLNGNMRRWCLRGLLRKGYSSWIYWRLFRNGKLGRWWRIDLSLSWFLDWGFYCLSLDYRNRLFLFIFIFLFRSRCGLVIRMWATFLCRCNW